MKCEKHHCRILWAVILTLLINVLCLPFWTEYGYNGLIWTLFNKEARVDFVYTGDELTASPPIVFKTIHSKPIRCTQIEGIDDKSKFFRLFSHRLRARSNWQKVSFKVNILQDGKITIILRGPDRSDDYGSSRYSVLTDWRNLRINGEEVFNEHKTLSFSKNYIKNVPIKKHEILQVDVEFRRHAFSIDDFVFPEFGKLWYIVTGNLLLFLLIYRLLSYFAKKRECVRSSSDILLIGAFFCCLFIPMSDISADERSARENRMLALKPEFKEFLNDNSNTGGGYEQWFSDHFGGRSYLLKLHDFIRNKISLVIRAKEAAYFKELGWSFSLPTVLDMKYEQSLIESVTQNLLQLNQFCQQNRIKLYVLEVPSKESVYKELLANIYGFDSKKFIEVSRLQEAIRKGAQKQHIPYIYPYGALCEAAKRDLTFFKWSIHWTEWGGFVGYCELMEEIRKDFTDIPVVSLNDYRKSKNRFIRDNWIDSYELGALYQLFNFRDDPHHSFFYNYYDHKDANKMKIKTAKFSKNFTYSGGKHKIMLIGSSQNDVLCRFLPYSAAELKYIRVNKGQARTADEFKIMKLYKRDILAFKPEILILSFSTKNLPKLRTLFSTK